MSGQALFFTLSHTLRKFMMKNGFPYKKDVPTLPSHNCIDAFKPQKALGLEGLNGLL